MEDRSKIRLSRLIPVIILVPVACFIFTMVYLDQFEPHAADVLLGTSGVLGLVSLIGCPVIIARKDGGWAGFATLGGLLAFYSAVAAFGVLLVFHVD